MSLNVTDEEDNLELQVTFRFYAVFGGTAIITNLINIIIINTYKPLQRKMTLYTALSFAEMINGIAYLVGAICREVSLAGRDSTKTLNPWICMTTKPWPVLFFLGGEFPALISFFLSLELMVASFYPGLYRAHWRYTNKVVLSYASFIICLCLNGVAFIAAKVNMDEPASSMCSVYEAAGTDYGVFHFIFVVVLYSVSTFLVFQAYRITRMTKAFSVADLRRQKLLLVINCVSSTFIAVPVLITLILIWLHQDPSLLFTGSIYCSFVFCSTLHFPLFFIFRREFRLRILFLLGRRRKSVPQPFQMPFSRSKITSIAATQVSRTVDF
uniref:G_PROTEIN_RECEP_F1_2 domain-containing protein n=1 Tax=Syphacia muris TaxID=451379 RepID=A0A0N5AM85_9BILA